MKSERVSPNIAHLRQKEMKFIGVSPNKAHLQTEGDEIHGNESEEGSSSDRRRRNPWE
jgi:hypothetical protein